jgi:histidinol-phosphate/aromatic aminotransferase/cobyric acid decarboxylase-like protein
LTTLDRVACSYNLWDASLGEYPARINLWTHWYVVIPDERFEATVQDLLRHGFASTRLSRYGLPGDARELQVLSELVRRCLATDAIEPDDLAVTNGSTEAISLLVEHLALRGMQAVIPCQRTSPTSSLRRGSACPSLPTTT